MAHEPPAETHFPPISAWIAAKPIAHRGLHDKTAGRFENTLSAAREAVKEGFAIEVDLHPSADRVPMVFHDLELDRLTNERGSMRLRKARDLRQISIGGTRDHVPMLVELLDAVRGDVGLVLEMKGHAGEDDGFVEAIARVIEDYGGPIAVMSFNHWLVEDARRLITGRPVGLTADGSDKLRDVHQEIAEKADVDFVSYGIGDLPCRFVAEFRERRRPVITWTIRSPEAAEKSALYADQITFEGFDPRRI
jgi:glycerophosphoryl diester phosphodiesterase